MVTDYAVPGGHLAPGIMTNVVSGALTSATKASAPPAHEYRVLESRCLASRDTGVACDRGWEDWHRERQ
jgi:hypothetical protein